MASNLWRFLRRVDQGAHWRLHKLIIITKKKYMLCPHINNICRSACLAIYKIGQIRRFIDRLTAERLVLAFVPSRLDANNSLLYGLPKNLIPKLQRVQNSAARLVVLVIVKARESIDAVRRNELHWLSVSDRIAFKILLITYKALNNLAPAYISDLLATYTPSYGLRSSSQSLSDPPRIREVPTINYGRRAFSVAAPELWNNISFAIRNAKSLAQFNGCLKLTCSNTLLVLISFFMSRQLYYCAFFSLNFILYIFFNWVLKCSFLWI